MPYTWIPPVTGKLLILRFVLQLNPDLPLSHLLSDVMTQLWWDSSTLSTLATPQPNTTVSVFLSSIWWHLCFVHHTFIKSLSWTTAGVVTNAESLASGLLVPTHGLLWALQVALVVKNLPASVGDIRDNRFDSWVRTITCRRSWKPTPLFLPGESPWTEEPGRLLSMGLQKVGYDWSGFISQRLVKLFRVHFIYQLSFQNGATAQILLNLGKF